MALNAKALTLVLVFALAATSCSSNGDSLATASTTTVPESVSDTPESIEPAEADPTTTTTTQAPTTEPTIDDPEETTTEVDNPAACDAPTNMPHYVDVALDDPDGGLNMRSAPGPQNDIVGVFPRSEELITTGGCNIVGTVDWWEVTSSDATLTGWVSSRFLSDLLVFNPGLGKAFPDTDNVGTGGATLDELAANLATAYGFDEDVVITMVGEVVGADAQGGSVVYDLTGLKDDASDGYRLEIDFIFDKNEAEDGGEVESYTAVNITSYDLCSRGVTEDGLCV